MADEQNGTNVQQPPQDGGQQTPPSGEGRPGPVPYERFTEVVNQKNEVAKELDELRNWKAKQEADAKAAQEAQLAEQQKWQELAEQREKELQTERTTNLRTRIAMQKGIPAEFVDRLRGGTEEEIAADADKMLAFIKPPTGPGVPPASRGGTPTPTDLSKLSPSEIRKLRQTA